MHWPGVTWRWGLQVGTWGPGPGGRKGKPWAPPVCSASCQAGGVAGPAHAPRPSQARVTRCPGEDRELRDARWGRRWQDAISDLPLAVCVPWGKSLPPSEPRSVGRSGQSAILCGEGLPRSPEARESPRLAPPLPKIPLCPHLKHTTTFWLMRVTAQRVWVQLTASGLTLHTRAGREQ